MRRGSFKGSQEGPAQKCGLFLKERKSARPETAQSAGVSKESEAPNNHAVSWKWLTFGGIGPLRAPAARNDLSRFAPFFKERIVAAEGKSASACADSLVAN